MKSRLVKLPQQFPPSRTEVADALTRFGITSTEEDIDLLFALTDDNKDGLINRTGTAYLPFLISDVMLINNSRT